MVAEPVKGLEEILLDNSRPKRKTRIGTLASPSIRQALMTFLRKNQDFFAWSHEDMLGIDPSVMVHRLNVSPSFPPIHQKKKMFSQERDKAITEEVCKLLDAEFIKEILSRLAGQCGDGQESQRKVEDICRLHELKRGMP